MVKGSSVFINESIARKRKKKAYILLLFILPSLIYLLIFCYGPMYGLQIAFRNYKVSKGFFGSTWVGLKWFRTFFGSYRFSTLLINTLRISIYQLLCAMPVYLLRQKDFDVDFHTRVLAERLDEAGECGISVFYNDAAHYDLCIADTGRQRVIRLKKHIGDMDLVAFEAPCADDAYVLGVEADKFTYRFYAVSESGERMACGSGVTYLVSTEAVPSSFTGVFLALYAVGPSQALFQGASYSEEVQPS